jgi:hypothetical protein
MMRSWLLAGGLALGAPGASSAPSSPELTPGAVVDRVELREDPSLSYALYLPRAYAAGREWPILYLFDARGRALVPLEVFQEAAERYGYILASSYDTASDVDIEPNIEVIRALWRDTHDRFAIDPRRVYMTGFSGLARVSCLMADQVPGAVTGVIACGAGFSPARAPREGMEFLLFGAVGHTDFNHDEMIRLDAARTAEEGSRVHDAHHRYLTLSQDFDGLRDVADAALLEEHADLEALREEEGFRRLMETLQETRLGGDDAIGWAPAPGRDGTVGGRAGVLMSW